MGDGRPSGKAGDSGDQKKLPDNVFDKSLNDLNTTGVVTDKTSGKPASEDTANPLLEGSGAYSPPKDAAVKQAGGPVEVVQGTPQKLDRAVIADGQLEVVDANTVRQEIVGPGGKTTIYNIHAEQVIINNGTGRMNPHVARIEDVGGRISDQGVGVRPGEGPVYVSIGGQNTPYFRPGPRGIPRHVGYGPSYGQNDGIVIDAPNGNFPVVRDTTMGGPTTIFRNRTVGGGVMDNPMIIQEQPRSIGFEQFVQLAQLGLIGYDISQNHGGQGGNWGGGRFGGNRGHIGYSHRGQIAGPWQYGGYQGDSMPGVTVMSDSGYIPPISQRDWQGPTTVFRDTTVGGSQNSQGFDQFLQVAQLGLIGLDIHNQGKANRQFDRQVAMNNSQRFNGGRIGYNNLAVQARMGPQNFQARLQAQRQQMGIG